MIHVCNVFFLFVFSTVWKQHPSFARYVFFRSDSEMLLLTDVNLFDQSFLNLCSFNARCLFLLKERPVSLLTSETTKGL